ncbi:hypothetical protein Tco_0775334 [Tanacetum coccineum]
MRAFWSLNEDISKIYYSEDQYAVSIKEDTSYPCLHSPKTTKERRSIRRNQKKSIRRIKDIVCGYSGRYQTWSLFQETLIRLIMEYLVNISKRRALCSLNKDILKIYYSKDQYAVSIKDDTAYPCLHSPKTTKERRSICRIQKKSIRCIEDIVSGYQQKDRKLSQNDKTEHGMEKTVQNQGQSPKMPKSESNFALRG